MSGSGGGSGGYAEFGRPRRVDGGLRARSTRGTIGRSWWSRRFVDVLESFALGTRLTRGRSYARAGQVLAMEIEPGVVTARVQGSRPTPYRVRIGLPPIPDPLWTRVEQTLAGQAFFSARLLAGDLPPELEEVFQEAGVPLFPGAVAELDQRCSCPDAAVPCKHLAAAFYLLAEAFDEDPFRLLHWRGRSRDALLDRLRALRSGVAGAAASDGRPTRSAGAGTATSPAPAVAASLAPTGPLSPAPTGAARVLADLPPAPLAEVVDRYWLPPVPLPERPPVLAAEPDLLLRQLGSPGGAIGGPGLVERLKRAYQAFGSYPPAAEPPHQSGVQ